HVERLAAGDSRGRNSASNRRLERGGSTMEEAHKVPAILNSRKPCKVVQMVNRVRGRANLCLRGILTVQDRVGLIELFLLGLSERTLRSIVRLIAARDGPVVARNDLSPALGPEPFQFSVDLRCVETLQQLFIQKIRMIAEKVSINSAACRLVGLDGDDLRADVG